MRNLSDECKTCIDNDKSMMMCIEICGVPMDILEKIESERKKDSMTIDGAIEYYSNKGPLSGNEALANTIALNILRRYKKIEEIYNKSIANDFSYPNAIQMIGGILNDN